MIEKGFNPNLKGVCNLNQIFRDTLKGSLEDKELKISLAKFLRHNLGITFWLLTGGLELLPFQEIILRGWFNNNFNLNVWTRGGSKSTLAAFFCFLYPIFYPKTKIVLTSANFRSSRRIFEEVERYVKMPNAQLLRQCFDPKNSSHKNDQFIWKDFNEGLLTAVPLSCIKGDSLITLEDGIYRIEDLFQKNRKNRERTWEILNEKFIWSENKFRDLSKGYFNGHANTKKIITKKGFLLESTLSHKTKICKNQEIIFEDAQNLKVGDYIPIDITLRWAKNPKYIYKPEDAYVVGLMIGDGSVLPKWSLEYTDKYGELITYIKKITGWDWRSGDDYHYYAYQVKRKREWMKKWKIGHWRALYKRVPDAIFQGTKECAANFIKGLFDADGNIQFSNLKGRTSCAVRLTNISYTLIKDVQYLLTHFGIAADIHYTKITKPNCHDKYDLLITGKDCEIYEREIGFNLKYKKNNLRKALANKVRPWMEFREVPYGKELVLSIISKIKLPRILKPQETGRFNLSKIKANKTCNLKFALKVLDRYSGHADHLEEYKKLKILANPNIFYDKIESIEDSQCITYDLNVPDNNEYVANGFLTHNSGHGLRGLRANTLIIDEFLLLSQSTIEEILKPFLVAKGDVQEQIRIIREEDRLIKEGKLKEEDRISNFSQAKVIGLTSASFKFEYCYTVYKQYIETILKKEKKNARHFVSQLSWEAIPLSILDKSIIEEAQNGGASNAAFQREYGAQFTDDSEGYFKASKMRDCTIADQEMPCIQIVGNKSSKYILVIDPSYSSSKQSDFFAMQVYELDEINFTITLAHSYGVAGGDLKNHIKYLYYILTRFNIVYLVPDGSSVDFIIAANESELFQKEKINIQDVGVNFDCDGEDYKLELSKARRQYRLLDRKIMVPQSFTNETVRRMNESLQASIDNKKVWFPSHIAPNDNQLKKAMEFEIPTLSFKPDSSDSERKLGKLDFIEQQDFWIDETKKQTALIEVKSNPQGSQTFTLPSHLSNSKSKTRARRDHYTCLLLANWGARCYFDLMSKPFNDNNSTFTPMFIA